MNLFIADAYAQAGAAAPNPILSFLPMIAIFAIFYFMLIRPQQKRQKAHRDMVTSLKVGDEIVTAGGVYGKIVEVSDDTVGTEVCDGVVMKVQRSAVSQILPKGSI